MKFTKIVATVNASTCTPELLLALYKNGMDVVRFNTAHMEVGEMDRAVAMVRRVSDKIAIMVDTKGPNIRTANLTEPLALKQGDTVYMTGDAVEAPAGVQVNYPAFAAEVAPGSRIVCDDGAVELLVLAREGKMLKCTAVHDGVLKNHKSVNVPDVELNTEALTGKDRRFIANAIELELDYIAHSFVRNAADIAAVRELLDAGKSPVRIIAKIENSTGVENIEAIIEASDGIMVARGDMGVEIPFEQLPAIQKKIITACRFRGKRVITATEMLESMINNTRPTRAEISDVANAVYDGTSAVMLSGETAAGKHPVEAVRAMAKIAEQAENDINYVKRFRNSDFIIKNAVDALSHACCALAIDINAKAIVVCTRSGATARMVSRFRQPKYVIGMTTDGKVWRKLALSWGVLPVMSEEFQSADVLFYHAERAAKETGLAVPGDVIVITGGQTNGCSGNSSLIKFETIK